MHFAKKTYLHLEMDYMHSVLTLLFSSRERMRKGKNTSETNFH